jgi:hypothetical protein
MRLAPLAVLCACSTSIAAVGCVGDDTNPAVPPTPDATAPPADATAGDSQVPPADAAPPPLPIGLLRLANWSSDAPGVDFCIAAHGTSAFTGPLLGQASAQLDAATWTLTYPQVSAYLQVPPGKYDVRAVVAGAVNCATGVGPDLTSPIALTIGTFATVALVGRAHGGASTPFQIASFVDEGVGGGSAKKVALRFLNVTSSIATADFGTGLAGTGFKPIFTGAPFGASGSIPDAGGADGAVTGDSLGYALLPPLASAIVSAHATSAATDAVVARGVVIAGGAVVTTALLDSNALSADGGATFQLLQCVDNAGTVGTLGSCGIVPP